MKTLNELIKSFELSCGKKDCKQCPYDDECLDHHVCECYERMNDALHYLKEYHEHLKWQAHKKHYLVEEKKKIKQAYEQGYAQAKQDDAVARSWKESYRQSQMPWNHYTEMGE